MKSAFNPEKIGTNGSKKSVYTHLFTPGKIGKLALKNRIVKSPQSTGLSNQDGTVSEKLVRHYRELAKGGTGLIIVEYTYIDNVASKSAHCQLGISNNEHIAGLSWLVSAIHDEGAKAGIQIEHCGRQKFLGTPPIKAPSRIPWPTLYEQTGVIPEELTIEEIKGIIEAFGDAARRAEQAGFDLAEIHAAHGYLITNFLSTHTNKRTDLYGGSLENRMRFLLEVIQNVKEKTSSNFPITMRINGTDYEPDGITIDETIEVCKQAEKLGIQAIHVSGGDHHMMNYQVSPMTIPSGPNVWAAEMVKQAVSVPVIASGSITMPGFAEKILAEGKGDFISLGRPLLADPYFPLKAEEGRPEDIVPCIRCNDGCLERTFFNFRSIRCSVNPNMGREGDFAITPASSPKNVLIIGGGPAGMEAARVSALRGHNVTLYEKGELGGSLIPAAASEFKSDLNNLRSYYLAQMEKLNIKIVHEEVTEDLANEEDFDAVIVAIGQMPKQLSVKGIEKNPSIQAIDILSGKADTGQNAVVVGGGLTGIETALYLANQGKNVTVIEQNKEIMNNELVTFKISYLQFINNDNRINVITSATLKEAAPKAVTIIQNGEQQEIPCDTIVAATGFCKSNKLFELLQQKQNLQVYQIGDGEKEGKIYDAVHSGMLIGLKL